MASQPETVSRGLPERSIVHKGQYVLKTLYNMILLWLDKTNYKSLDFKDSIFQTGERFYFEKINPDSTKETTIWIAAEKEAEAFGQKANFEIKMIIQILRQIDGQITVKGEQKVVNQGDVRIIVRPKIHYLNFRKDFTIGQIILQALKLIKLSEKEKIDSMHKLEQIFKEELDNLLLYLKKHLDLAHNEIKDDLIHQQFDNF